MYVYVVKEDKDLKVHRKTLKNNQPTKPPELI